MQMASILLIIATRAMKLLIYYKITFDNVKISLLSWNEMSEVNFFL